MERAEKIGLGVATAGHVLLFALLSTGFPAPNPLKLHSPPMDVSLVDEAALQSTAPVISTQPPPPSQAPEKGPTEDAAPQPAPVPDPAPQPEPRPEPAPKPKPAPPAPKSAKPKPAKPEPAASKPTPKAQPKPKQEPKPRSEPDKPSARAKPAPDKPKAAAASAAPKSRAAPKTDTPAKASGAGRAEKPRGSLLGDDFLKGIKTETPAPRRAAPPQAAAMGAQQKAALDRLISDQIYRHLRLPSGADVELLVAFLDVKLDRNGRVIGTPSVIDIQGDNASNRPQVAIYKERAIQAVMQASPFKGLPAEHYEQWKWLSPLRVYARKAR
ncbi:MAG: cell envelope biogenesis protein TolA [Sphingobium sp.]